MQFIMFVIDHIYVDFLIINKISALASHWLDSVFKGSNEHDEHTMYQKNKKKRI